MRYEYVCSECEHIFEKILPVARMNEPKEAACPNCQAEGTIDRYISAGATFGYNDNKYKGDSTFQKYVLGKIQEGIPRHLRSSNKYSIPKEY